MAQSVFGAGNLWGIPVGVANPTPVRFAALQDVSVDFSFDLKTLHGSSQFALENAKGKGKIAIKAAIGRFDPNLFNTIFFGQTITTGETIVSVDETAAIPATPYQITVANSATFLVDLGVYDTTAGKWLKRVASAPATGQYSVAAGVYTYAAADTTHVVRGSYTYGSASTGSTITATNLPLGSQQIFSLELFEYFTGGSGRKNSSLYFPAVQSNKLSMPMKMDDFSLPSFEMSAQDDGNGNIFTWTLTG
jgi:hypothetical protein